MNGHEKSRRKKKERKLIAALIVRSLLSLSILWTFFMGRVSNYFCFLDDWGIEGVFVCCAVNFFDRILAIFDACMGKFCKRVRSY